MRSFQARPDGSPWQATAPAPPCARGPRVGARLALALCLLGLPALARAQTVPAAPRPVSPASGPPAKPAATPATVGAKPVEAASILDGYLKQLEQQQLLPPPAQSVDELSLVLDQAQRALLDGRMAEASGLLLGALEGPRFRAFHDFAPYHTAALTLSGLLLEQHALKSAQRTVDSLLMQGPEIEAFGPAYRRAIDIALVRGDLAASAQHLSQLVPTALPEDAQNELHYLKALAAHDRDDFKTATPELLAISKRSRFFANAQYLLGAIAAKDKNFKEAEARFCSIAGAGKDDAFSFYVDGRFFPVRDLAQLGLGRVAHETGRGDDAFYYYFQVPNDSSRVSEALFEAAWASYEGNDHDAALDSLDQLDARFPRSPYAAEAGVLRGYVHLSRCEFGEAEKHLVTFERTFASVLREIGASLQSPSRKQTIYRDLVAREQSIALLVQQAKGEPSPDSVLLALVAADPEFYKLHAQIRALDAELSSTGHVPDELYALSARVKSKDAPAPRLSDDDSSRDAIAALTKDLTTAKAAIDAFSGELAQLSRAGAEKGELTALYNVRKSLDRRVDELSSRLRALLAKTGDLGPPPSASELSARLLEDKAYVERARTRALRVRAELENRANQAGEAALVSLRDRLAKELRRARIGRIDAVMGSKRQVELQVESLAAGRFPPELVDPLRMQSLLRDDEEYWPFEGEDWPDEFVERYAEEEP